MAKMLRPVLGAYKLRELTARQALNALRKIGETRSTRTVEMAHNTLARAITLAMAEDKVGRNVAQVIKTPAGKKVGQKRQAFSLQEMLAVMEAARAWPWRNMDAYIHLGFMTGASPDELSGLHWAQVDDLDSDAPGIDITRTSRHYGGTKTAARVRGLGLPQPAVEALRRHRAEQAATRLAAGSEWEDNDLVFCTRVGRPLDRGNIARAFKTICEKAVCQRRGQAGALRDAAHPRLADVGQRCGGRRGRPAARPQWNPRLRDGLPARAQTTPPDWPVRDGDDHRRVADGLIPACRSPVTRTDAAGG